MSTGLAFGLNCSREPTSRSRSGGSKIVATAGAIYRRVLARDPEFGDQMIDASRDREVSAAYRETG